MLGRPGTDSATPVEVVGIANAVAIDAGNNHVCALRATGRIACWGRNRNGNLGDTDLADHPTPFEVPSVTGALAVCAGDFFTCARLATGVVCWGTPASGRLGNPDADPDGDLVQAEPVPVIGLPPIVRLVCGGNHVCGRTATGDLYCWGQGSSGQLGDGLGTSRAMPAPVLGFP